jgi:hypothetical protein
MEKIEAICGAVKYLEAWIGAASKTPYFLPI